MQDKVTLTIDGQSYEAQAGETVLDVARANGVYIPTLCHFPGLSSVGACRLCVVEAKGVPRLLPACVTRVTEGMAVTTQSPRLVAYRRMIIELLLAERNHVCAVCVSNGHCELQTLAQRLGVTHTRFPYRYPALPVDASHARFVYDPNRCVLCTRCVRVCNEIEGACTWNVSQRGIHSMLVTDMDQPWGDSPSCTSCGKCVHVCPTGALYEKGKATGEMVKRRNVIARRPTTRPATAAI